MGLNSYLVGVARQDITPPVGIRLCGYAVREGLSREIGDPLTATALVIRGSDNTVALLALDLTIVSLRLAAQLRARCAAVLGVPASHVLLNLNHTHSAPILPDFQPYEEPAQAEIQRQYERTLLERCERVCADALARLEPARIAVGWGECAGNCNRRVMMPDGSVLLGLNREGIRDTSVGVIRVDRMDGTPLAVAFRYSCHPVTLGPLTNVISPDFIGPARDVVEREMNCLSLFLQGCAGNLIPATGIGSDSKGREETDRLGRMLGGEVLKICQTLRTHREPAEPRLVASVAPYWLYGWKAVPPGERGSIRVAERELELPLTPFPPLAEVERERAEWAAKLDGARRRAAPEWERNVAGRFDYWSQLRLDAARSGANPRTVRFPVQAIGLDELVLVGIPFETMAETGMQVRADSPHANTFVLGYSNGIISYLPTPEISREGGMEARLGYKNYLLPSEVPGNWEPAIRRAALDLTHNASSTQSTT